MSQSIQNLVLLPKSHSVQLSISTRLLRFFLPKPASSAVMKSPVNLCWVILLLTATALEARHHHRSHHHRKRDHNVYIEIYYPKGLMVWYPKQQGMIGFGIEIYLNQKHSSNEPKCDICLNSTEVSYGKFMIRSDDAIVRAGDHLKYRGIKQMANGTIQAMKSNEFYVADYRIMPRLEMCSSLVPTSGSTKNQSQIAALDDEVNLLQHIIYDVFQHCNNITQTSKNLFLHTRPTNPLLDSKALHNHTLHVLKKMSPKMEWDKMLVHAFYYEHGVGFEVKTLIDKLKILQMSKNSIFPHGISDLDDLDHSEFGSGKPEGHSQLSVDDIRMSN